MHDSIEMHIEPLWKSYSLLRKLAEHSDLDHENQCLVYMPSHVTRRLHDILSSENLVASLLGNLIASLLGNLIASLSGNLVASLLGNLVASFLGNLITSLSGNLVASLLENHEQFLKHLPNSTLLHHLPINEIKDSFSNKKWTKNSQKSHLTFLGDIGCVQMVRLIVKDAVFLMVLPSNQGQLKKSRQDFSRL